MYTLGIPNGSLFEPTVKLLERLGAILKINGRKFIATVEGLGVFDKTIIMRPQDIPEAIIDGTIDCGICGWDCVEEVGLGKRLSKIVELNYSKTSKGPVRIVVYGKDSSLNDTRSVRVTAEYPNLARRVFEKAVIRFSHGTTEAKVVSGKYQYGVGVVESGKSLEDNNLKVVKVILTSPTVFMAKDEKQEFILFGNLLKGGLQSEKYCLLKMNVSKQKRDAVIEILPALRAPTVSKLADGWFALETVVQKNIVADLIVKLQRLGAEGILVLGLNIVL